MFYDTPGSSWFPFWPLSSIHSPWYIVLTSNLLIYELNKMLHSIVAGKFNNFQAVLSPTENYIQNNIFGDLQQLSTPGNVAVAHWLDEMYENGNVTTATNGRVRMLSTDFVGDESGVPLKVIRLNELIQVGERSSGGGVGRMCKEFLRAFVVVGCSPVINFVGFHYQDYFCNLSHLSYC